MKAALLTGMVALAGFALGAFSGKSSRDPVDALREKSASEHRESGALRGAGDPRETALGNALDELRQSRNDLRGFARLGDALALLDAEQIAKMLDHLEASPDEQASQCGWLFHWWMKRDPAAAAAWLRPRLATLAQDGPLGESFTASARGAAALAWADADPQAALDFARSHPRTGLAAQLLSKAISAWPDQDDRHRLALLLDFPKGRARAAALRELLASWAGREPAAAFASATTLDPGRERDQTIRDVLRKWGASDPGAAFAQYRALGLSDPRLLAEMLEKSSATQPAQTLAWLTQLDAGQFARSAPKVVEAWAASDPAAALGWALANGVRLSGGGNLFADYVHDGFGRSMLVSSYDFEPFRTALEKQPEATLAWLRSLPPGAERDRVTETAIGAMKDARSALSLFATLPPDSAARTAFSMGKIFGDAEEGRAWARSLPPGPVRIKAWQGLANSFQKPFDLPSGPDRDAVLAGKDYDSDDVEEQMQALSQISDPILRRDEIDAVMELTIEIFGPAASDKARAALEKTNVPDEWKQRWRAAPGK